MRAKKCSDLGKLRDRRQAARKGYNLYNRCSMGGGERRLIKPPVTVRDETAKKRKKDRKNGEKISQKKRWSERRAGATSSHKGGVRRGVS